jgi:hypothetical protein
VDTRASLKKTGEEENLQPLPGFKPPINQPVAERYTTELSRLPCPMSTGDKVAGARS